MLVSKKKYNESVKYVVESYNEEREEEKETLNYIIEKKGSPLNCMWFLGRLHAITASKNLLVDKDVESFKKNMYVFAKLSILGKESRNFLGWDRVSFWGIIMSNNPVLLEFIERYINIIAYEREGYKYKKS